MPDHRCVPVQFLKTAFDPGDWIGVLLKTYQTGRVAQRIVSRDTAAGDRFQAWLRHMNAHGWNVYVSVNAYKPGRSRARDAVAGVRHLFLEEDSDGPGLLATLSTRPDLPPPSYVVHSSPGRLHALWRVREITPARIEALQKQLAREFGTDRAATSSAQTTRLPGFFNHKRRPAVRVGIEFLHGDEVFGARDLPDVSTSSPPVSAPRAWPAASTPDRVARARAFLRRVEPAVAGQRGDLHTFRVCCRIVRGFDLTDDESLSVLEEWNARCEPPWSENELLQKVVNATKYGREEPGGML
jgi:hypothetical protein